MSSSSATNSTFATMRAKISVGTHYAVNHVAGGLQTPRIAKRMAALNLTTVTSTPATTPPRPKANAFTAD